MVASSIATSQLMVFYAQRLSVVALPDNVILGLLRAYADTFLILVEVLYTSHTECAKLLTHPVSV